MECRAGWAERDAHRWLGPLAAVGLVAGATLAVFGLPPVDLHGPWHEKGLMGPTCGATRAMHAAMLGRFGEAWHFNPLSPLLILGAVATLVREAVGRLTGRWLNLYLSDSARRAGVVAVLLLLAALTVNQQTHADLLATGPEVAGATRMPPYLAVPLLVAAVATAILWPSARRHRTDPGT